MKQRETWFKAKLALQRSINVDCHIAMRLDQKQHGHAAARLMVQIRQGNKALSEEWCYKSFETLEAALRSLRRRVNVPYSTKQTWYIVARVHCTETANYAYPV